jgi:hypothetical protein
MSQLVLVIHVVHRYVHHVVRHVVVLVAFLQDVRIHVQFVDMMEVMHIPVGINLFLEE